MLCNPKKIKVSTLNLNAINYFKIKVKNDIRFRYVKVVILYDIRFNYKFKQTKD